MKTMTPIAAMVLLGACSPAPADHGATASTTMSKRTAPVTARSAPTPASRPDEAAGEERTRVEELAGDWHVVGVRPAAGPVQAVTDDDPVIMGAVLSISPDRLAWKPHKGGSFADECPGPQIGPDGTIGCAEGEFGPPGAHLSGEGDHLRLDWYDGAVLVLSRR